MVPDPSLTINEVIITSLLFLKIIKGVCLFFFFVILPHTLLSGLFYLLRQEIDRIWILAINSTI